MMIKKRIELGVYLVADPSYGEEKVIKVVTESLKSGLSILQLWASWQDNDRHKAIELGRKLSRLANEYSTPFVVNNDLDVALSVGADGVHIDGTEPSPDHIRGKIGEHCIVGATCSTNIEKVVWAQRMRLDYISFCSMYPSSSVNECDIVPMRMVTQARRITSMPIFASGGINLKNAHEVIQAGADGVAVISTIMNAEDPGRVTAALKEIVLKYRNSWIAEARSNA